MKKIVLLTLGFLFITTIVIGQKTEHISIDWPIEYDWKIARQVNDSSHQLLQIIPGKQKIKNAQIIGTMEAYSGVHYDSVSQIIAFFAKAIDEGTKLTILEKNDSTKYYWAIFKVETPKTLKYPEPESDLYYVVQGEYALYANYVAIKKEKLDDAFVATWAEIFKNSQVVIE
jgi:hypothetical protein